MTRLAWLTKSAVEATASPVKAEIDKLMFLRAMDAHVLDMSILAAERRRFLATVGRRSTNQALQRREPRAGGADDNYASSTPDWGRTRCVKIGAKPWRRPVGVYPSPTP